MSEVTTPRRHHTTMRIDRDIVEVLRSEADSRTSGSMTELTNQILAKWVIDQGLGGRIARGRSLL